MYCKRNWLAEHCTPFIFLQPFHLHRDPNLTTVWSWYSTGILWEPWPKNPWQKITENDKETTPSCGQILKKESYEEEIFIFLQGHLVHSFVLKCPEGILCIMKCDRFQDRQIGNKQRRRQTHEQRCFVCGFPPALSPFEMATHELKCVMIWRRHVEH